MIRRLASLGPALWAAAACAVLFGGIGVALGVAWLAGGRADGEAAEPPAPVDLAAAGLRRCPYCGTIESKRQITPAKADAHAAPIYEYTVRMNDGSLSTFEEALPASWRLGERLTVIR